MSDFLSPAINNRLKEKDMDFRERAREIVIRLGWGDSDTIESYVDEISQLFLDTIEKAKPSIRKDEERATRDNKYRNIPRFSAYDFDLALDEEAKRFRDGLLKEIKK
jgi:hypothetical protein